MDLLLMIFLKLLYENNNKIQINLEQEVLYYLKNTYCNIKKIKYFN